MINAQMKNREAAPVWAVLGAPLLGIPLLVAILSLAAPEAPAPESESASMVTIERVEEPSVEPASSCVGTTVAAPARKS